MPHRGIEPRSEACPSDAPPTELLPRFSFFFSLSLSFFLRGLGGWGAIVFMKRIYTRTLCSLRGGLGGEFCSLVSTYPDMTCTVDRLSVKNNLLCSFWVDSFESIPNFDRKTVTCLKKKMLELEEVCGGGRVCTM